ncbi:Os03g0775900, partial [Oryza sativa Japonica Group]
LSTDAYCACQRESTCSIRAGIDGSKTPTRRLVLRRECHAASGKAATCTRGGYGRGADDDDSPGRSPARDRRALGRRDHRPLRRRRQVHPPRHPRPVLPPHPPRPPRRRQRCRLRPYPPLRRLLQARSLGRSTRAHRRGPTVGGRRRCCSVRHLRQVPRPHSRAAAATVASRDVLVVLRERPVGVRAFCTVPRQQLCICNSLTGDTTRLPMSDVVDDYPPAFLATGGAGRSYELLVMDKRLQTQTFSSEDGKWGAIRAMEELPHPISSPLYAHRPLVVSRRNAVYWLCPQRLGGVTADLHILAVDVGADRRRASRIELPPDCLSRMKPFGWQSDGIILAPSPSPDGELSLIVAEVLVISQWTLLPSSSSSSSEGGSPAARWSRQVVISRLAIDRQAGHDMFMGVVCFHGLGLVSGAVLMQVRVLDTVLIALLHLASKECLILRRWDKMSRPSELCLHEIDLASVLQSM